MSLTLKDYSEITYALCAGINYYATSMFMRENHLSVGDIVDMKKSVRGCSKAVLISGDSHGLVVRVIQKNGRAAEAHTWISWADCLSINGRKISGLEMQRAKEADNE